MSVLQRFFLAVCCFGAPLLSFDEAGAQTADAIVNSLRPRSQPLTRSISRQERSSPEDRAFLRELPTRSIRIEQRAKLAEIVKKDQLPKIDLTINFDYDSDVIKPSSVKTLVALGTALSDPALKSARVLLNGHTDAAGGDQYNLALSERRAQSVKAYLVKHFAIPDARLLAIGYGKEQPKNAAAPMASENRRVEVVNLGSN